jgi:CheY-specific phosphatase CheX
MTQTTAQANLDALLVNALIEATKDIFSTMANSQLDVKSVKPQRDYTPTGDISAIIGIMGSKGEGMVSLSFGVKTANLIVSRLLGIQQDAVSSDDRCDGIGELVNMISGNAKTKLSQESDASYKLSLPTIILGEGHEIATRPKNNPYLHICFGLEGGQEFNLQVSFKFH